MALAAVGVAGGEERGVGTGFSFTSDNSLSRLVFKDSSIAISAMIAALVLACNTDKKHHKKLKAELSITYHLSKGQIPLQGLEQRLGHPLELSLPVTPTGETVEFLLRLECLSDMTYGM